MSPALRLAYDPVLPVYTVASPLPADFIVEAQEEALADAGKAARAFQAIGAAAGMPVEVRTVETTGTAGFGGLVAEVHAHRPRRRRPADPGAHRADA